MWGFSDHPSPNRKGSDVCYRLHLTVRSEFECSARLVPVLGLAAGCPSCAAVSAESDLNTLAPSPEGLDLWIPPPANFASGDSRAPKFRGEVNPFRVRLYSAGVRETSRQGAGPPVGGPIGALSTTRHETHTSLTKCPDNGPSRSRFRDHGLTRLSSRASEVGSCQLIEGPSEVWPKSHAQAGAAARQRDPPAIRA